MPAMSQWQHRIWKPYLKWAPCGPTKAQGSKAKHASRVSVAKSKQSEGPHRGDPAPSSFISESQLGSFHHPLTSGLASSRSGSPNRDDPGMMRETTRAGLALEEH
jgi:hypothetical protein